MLHSMSKIISLVVIKLAIPSAILLTMMSNHLLAQAQPVNSTQRSGSAGSDRPSYFLEEPRSGAKIPFHASTPQEAATKAHEIISQLSSRSTVIQEVLEALGNLPTPQGGATYGKNTTEGLVSWGCTIVDGWAVCKWL
jgi:hypothetical protein